MIKGIYRLTALVLAACLVLCSCGQKRDHYELSQDLRLVFSNADTVIPAIRDALRRHDTAIHIQCSAELEHMEDISPLVRELMDYALMETDNPKEGDYIHYQYGGYELAYGHEGEGGEYTYTLTITPIYYTDLEQEEEVDEEVDRILREMQFQRSTSDEEKVRVIYDYVCEHVAYDTIHKTSNYHLKSTAYAALLRGSAGCQGYSVLMYRLLRESGVNCRVITGMAEYEGESEYHAWNLVEVDGLWYNLDATWGARLDTDDYYLKCDADFGNHVRDAEFADAEFYEKYPMAIDSL